MVDEIWKQVPGYDDYQVSNLGRIKSFKNGNERFIHPSKKPTGHLEINLCKDGKPKKFLVHYLVLLSFVGERPKGYDIRHLDSNPQNNALSNLAYGTRSENEIDCSKVGNHKSRKLTDEDVLAIRSLLSQNVPQRAIAKQFGIRQSCVWAIGARKTYSWL